MWWLVVLVASFCQVQCQGFYKVTGPKGIRPNSEYNVAISVQGTSVPTVVRAAIQGASYVGRPFSTEDVVTVPPYSTKIARLEIGDIQPGSYKLIVQGNGGTNFQSSSPLKYIEKSYSVFIQTDKAVYKPGSKILFRVLVLNPELKPAVDAKTKPLNIHVSDGAGNIVKEWNGIFAPNGVFAGELLLSENPVLGNWNISATINGQQYNKTVEVASYILPKFIIDIQAPKHITFTQNTLTAHIQTYYTYGKKVKGDATVTVYPTIYSGVIQPIFQTPIRKVIPIDGSATVDFDIAKELRLDDEYERTVVIDVTIEEALTKRRQNNSIEVHIHKYDYKMELVKTADYYKPGLKYVAYVKVTNHDGSPIAKDRRAVTIRYGFSRVDEVYIEERHVLDKNGVLNLELDTPRNSTNETALRIEADYYELKERMPPVPAAVSKSKTYLSATLETEFPTINKQISILVNCTEPMKYLNYEVLGRGDVLIARSVVVDGRNEHRFQFTAIHAMVPTAHLLVSFVRDDGELVADSLDFEVGSLLQNFIDIQANTFETYPDTEIDIEIKTQKYSYVGLMAVDQNNAKLRSGYDVVENDVAKELKRYDTAVESPYYAIMKDSESHFFWKPGSSNAQDLFEDSGAVLLTNAYVSSSRPTLEDVYLRPVFYGSSTVKPDRGVGISFHTVTRPPLAGPYAFSRIPRPVWDKPKVYLTEDIADTWLFTNFSSGSDGKYSNRQRVPNTLTTWVITGFSLDPLHGLGLPSGPRKIKVSKPFVVTCDLPHSVQRGEVVSIPVVVHNNMNKDITAEVTIHNEHTMFEFADVSNTKGAKKIELYKRKKLEVKRNSVNAASFMLTTTAQGSIEIKITASSSGMVDSTTKYLRVLPEGEPQYYTKTVLVDLRKTDSFKGNVSIEIPKNIVKDSEKIEVSVVGDLLGPAMVNLEDLIRLPTGCGEQNLVHFMPNLIILNYLKNTAQLTPTIQNEAIRHLETAYQQQLTYKRSDGSFSIFGKRDTNGSIWLTAYVSLAFNQARSYIYIDDSIVINALKWLSANQATNGSFVETGNVVHEELQNRDKKSLALTAYVLLTFQQNQFSDDYRNTINKGLDYIARYLTDKEDVYTIAICSYVLQLFKHPTRQTALYYLDIKAKTANNSKWWARDIPKNETQNPWNYLPKSMDIETTAYALLTFLDAGLVEDAIPVVNWIVNQQNNLGGFTSSQDTVVGLYALYKLVLQLSVKTNVQFEFQYREQEVNRMSINQNTAMIVQKMELGKSARLVNVTAKGSGYAIFRVSYQYNMNVTGAWPMFTLDPQVDKNSNKDHLQLSICSAFVSRNLSMSGASNMAVMEVTFPSGFTADVDSLPSLEVSQNVQKVETKNKDTTVVLYFNNFTTYEYCPTVSAFRTHKVARQKPVSVILYDYYDSSRRARIFYQNSKTTLCDICDGDDCGEICKNDPNFERYGGTGTGSGITASRILIAVLSLLGVIRSGQM